ncbi:MAG: hypothetical protein O3C57_02965, partial [Verrucomicrobia bacterium]|nr:hypothetical protein [Verrucomicrobiota bacterium]
MPRKRTIVLAYIALALLIEPLSTALLAQGSDEDTMIVAEELAIEEAIEGDLIVEDIDDAGLVPVVEEAPIAGNTPSSNAISEDFASEDDLPEDVMTEDDLLEDVMTEDDLLEDV